MGTFQITAPDGKKYKVSGDTAEGAHAALMKHLGGAVQSAAPQVETSAPAAEKANGSGPSSVNTGIPPEMVFDPRTGGYMDAALAAQRMPAISKAAAVAAQGIPFAGEYFDEAVGKMSGVVGAEQIAREAQAQFKKEKPKSSMALQVGTGIAATAPIAAGATLGGTTLLGKTARATGAGMAAGGAEGAISGYGAGEGQDRWDSAGERAAFGAAFGAILGGLSPTVSAGLRTAITKMKNMPVEQAAKELGTTKEVVQTLRSVVDIDDPARAQDVVDSLGASAMLADFGDGLAGQLDTAMAKSGSASTTARRAIEGRLAERGIETAKVFDNILGAPVGATSATRAIRAETREAVSQAYATPFSKSVGQESNGSRRIRGVLANIPTKRLDEALSAANEEMALDAIRDGVSPQPPITAKTLADFVDGKDVDIPVQHLDAIKRGLDGLREAGVDRIQGTTTPEARRAGEWARQLRSAIAEAEPSYRDALDSAADAASRRRAVEVGEDLLRTRTSRDVARQSISGMSSAEKVAAKQGVASYIDDQLSNVYAVASDPNVEVREVSKMLRLLTSKSSRYKLTQLLGPEDASKIFDEVEKSAIALKLRAATSANSKTFARTATNEQVQAMVKPNIFERGDIMQAPRAFIQAATGASDEAVGMRAAGVYADVADFLVNIKGKEAEKALKLLSNVNVDEPLSQARANVIAKAITSALIPAQQEATRQGVE